MTSNILQNILKKKDQGVLESQNIHKDNTNPDITNKTNEELKGPVSTWVIAQISVCPFSGGEKHYRNMRVTFLSTF